MLVMVGVSGTVIERVEGEEKENKLDDIFHITSAFDLENMVPNSASRRFIRLILKDFVSSFANRMLCDNDN